MPSTNQVAKTDTRDFESYYKRLLAEKNDLTIAALIRGIRTPERAQEYIEAEVGLADDEDRDPRKDVIGALNRRKAILTPDEDDKEQW